MCDYTTNCSIISCVASFVFHVFYNLYSTLIFDSATPHERGIPQPQKSADLIAASVNAAMYEYPQRGLQETTNWHQFLQQPAKHCCYESCRHHQAPSSTFRISTWVVL